MTHTECLLAKIVPSGELFNKYYGSTLRGWSYTKIEYDWNTKKFVLEARNGSRVIRTTSKNIKTALTNLLKKTDIDE